MENFELSNRTFALASVLIAAIVVAILAGIFVQLSSLPGSEPRYITVSGEGQVYASPDIALVSFGITKNGTDIAKLSSKVNETMNAIISDLKDLGIEDKDIQTTQYSINPYYDYPEYSKRILSGYDITQSINVKIRDFSKISQAFVVATDAGANLVNDLYFSIDNPEEFNQQAREKAIAQAKEKAQNIASASGLKLVKMTNISEEGYYSPMYGYAKATGGGYLEVAPDIQPGEEEISMSVVLTYLVR
ncbi:SIMPL domain-containing protein [Patescibacteria group bacterium]|nr:SIMPL domain-containing protein [Patescibacteria group bacterium]